MKRKLWEYILLAALDVACVTAAGCAIEKHVLHPQTVQESKRSSAEEYGESNSILLRTLGIQSDPHVLAVIENRDKKALKMLDEKIAESNDLEAVVRAVKTTYGERAQMLAEVEERFLSNSHYYLLNQKAESAKQTYMILLGITRPDAIEKPVMDAVINAFQHAKKLSVGHCQMTVRIARQIHQDFPDWQHRYLQHTQGVQDQLWQNFQDKWTKNLEDAVSFLDYYNSVLDIVEPISDLAEKPDTKLKVESLKFSFGLVRFLQYSTRIPPAPEYPLNPSKIVRDTG